MTRRLLVNGAIVALVLLLGGGYAALSEPPALDANGPTRLQGTRQGDVVMVASHQVREMRYRDQALLDYAFRLTNAGALPVTVTGIAPDGPGSPMLRLVGLRGPRGEREFRVPAYGSRDVHLIVKMTGCRRAPARSGVAGTVSLRTERFGLSAGTVRVRLPEKLRAGLAPGRCPAA